MSIDKLINTLGADHTREYFLVSDKSNRLVIQGPYSTREKAKEANTHDYRIVIGFDLRRVVFKAKFDV